MTLKTIKINTNKTFENSNNANLYNIANQSQCMVLNKIIWPFNCNKILQNFKK